MANQDKIRWYDGWKGFVPNHQDEDYHVGGNHLPLEELGKQVADQQSRKDRHSRV
jgi:hypothetical protein